MTSGTKGPTKVRTGMDKPMGCGKVGGVLWSFLEPEYAWFISKSLKLQFCATQHTSPTSLYLSMPLSPASLLPSVGKAWSSGSALYTEDISLALRAPLASLQAV